MSGGKLAVRLLGTCCVATSKDGKVATIRNKKYLSVRERTESDGTKFYTFSGPDPLNLGVTSMINIRKNAMALISDKIDDWECENKNPEDRFQLTIFGHSRGAVAATRVYDDLKNMYRKDKRITIKLRISDPYAGPTYSKGKNVSIDLRQNQSVKNNDPNEDKNSDIENDDNIIFYSMGTLFPCSPQKIMNAKTIVICRAGHIKTEDYMFDAVNGKNYEILKKGGIYLLDAGDKILCKVTEKNLKEAMEIIYSWKRSYRARTRVLTEVMIRKLNLKVDDILEMGAVKEWKPAFEKTLRKVKDSKFLRTAFNYVLDLFSDKLFGLYINKKGKFFRCIKAAESAVAGSGNNDYQTALYKLDIIIKESKHPYKRVLANALKERIMRYYKLENNA